ncbi:MAG TPA: PD-(D/E)XK nuclease family protein [Actinomycetota bacterium]|nr:PD-(D/E)XK nuclease family protein [Actinomycetota bacterium]
MQLTDPQRRTLDQLIGTGERPVFAADLVQRLRDRIEDATRELAGAETLWIGKEKLNDLARCEGAFAAKVAGEAPPFEHSGSSAAGVLLHKAIEVEVGSRDLVDPHELASAAADRLVDREERFAEFWRARSALEQDDLLMQAVRGLVMYQGSFPPLRDLRRELSPATEAGMRAELLGGALVLSGKVDLLLGAPDRVVPMRGTRLVIDLKTGGAYPNYVEDNRFYALLLALRFGVPPYRVASFFLEGGTWQAEDVDEDILFHAADRVIAAARAATSLQAGREPVLTPGPWCGWCPRAATCPVAEI